MSDDSTPKKTVPEDMNAWRGPFGLIHDWKVVRSAPSAFASCVIVGVLIGATLVWRLYETFVIPGKDVNIELWKSSSETQEKKATELATKSDNLQNQLTQWQTMPAAISSMYSNIVTVYATQSNNTTLALLDHNSSGAPLVYEDIVLTKATRDRLSSEIAKVKPLETWIKLVDDQPKTKRLAQEIRDILMKGGFTSVHVSQNTDIPPAGMKEIEASGLRIYSEDQLERPLPTRLWRFNG